MLDMLEVVGDSQETAKSAAGSVPALTPHPANAPGNFYVADGCCTMCGVPTAGAPVLFGEFADPRGWTHCYVKRQPESPEDLDKMLGVIRTAELKCIRYCGRDRQIQKRLIDAGEGDVCDYRPAGLTDDARRDGSIAKRAWLGWWRCLRGLFRRR